MTNDLYADDPALKPEADISLMLSFDFYGIDNSLFAKAGLYGFQQGELLSYIIADTYFIYNVQKEYHAQWVENFGFGHATNSQVGGLRFMSLGSHLW